MDLRRNIKFIIWFGMSRMTAWNQRLPGKRPSNIGSGSGKFGLLSNLILLGEIYMMSLSDWILAYARMTSIL